MKRYSEQEAQAPMTIWHKGEPFNHEHCPHCDRLVTTSESQAVLLAERGYYERTGLYRCECGGKFTHVG